MRVGRELDFGLVVGRPHARTLDRQAPAAERHLARGVAVTDSGPVGVVSAVGADHLIDFGFHQLGEDGEPNTDAERQQALLRYANKLAQRLLHALGQHSLFHARLRERYVASHGGSSLSILLDHPPRSQPERTGEEGPPSLTKFYKLWDILLERSALTQWILGHMQPSRAHA